jgi:hypothetical protein
MKFVLTSASLSRRKLCLLVSVASAIVFPIRAATILFSDLTDEVTLTGSSRIVGVSCIVGFGFAGEPVEVCSGTVSAPSLIATITQIAILGRDSPGGGIAFYSEASPSGTILSDAVDFDFSVSDSSPALIFTSDIDSSPVLCSAIGGCATAETGGIQTAGSITWSDGTVDTIQLQSDAVPEPSSLPLLLILAMMLGVWKCRCTMKNRSSNWRVV